MSLLRIEVSLLWAGMVFTSSNKNCNREQYLEAETCTSAFLEKSTMRTKRRSKKRFNETK